MAENQNEQTIIFFDGVCHLCNGFIDYLVSKDRRHSLKYAPLQGTTAQKFLKPEHYQDLETVILYHDGKIYLRSTAALKALILLGGAFQLLNAFLIIPSPIRDLFYKLIANNRYQLFGKRDTCRLPSPEEKAYLLD